MFHVKTTHGMQQFSPACPAGQEGSRPGWTVLDRRATPCPLDAMQPLRRAWEGLFCGPFLRVEEGDYSSWNDFLWLVLWWFACRWGFSFAVHGSPFEVRRHWGIFDTQRGLVVQH